MPSTDPLVLSGFGDNYGAEVVEYTDVIREDLHTDIENKGEVINAGTYKIAARLNAKWGEWDDDTNSLYYMTYVVERATVNLNSTIEETGEYMLTWVDNNNENVALGTAEGTKEKAALYVYNGDGVYLAKKLTDPAYTVQIAKNSTIGLASQSIAPILKDNKYIKVTSDDVTRRNVSGVFTDKYTIQLKDQNNYVLEYVEEDGKTEFSDRGISLDGDFGAKGTAVTLNKTWYIIMQTNWITDSLHKGEEDKAPSYVMVKRNSDGAAINTWTYGESVDDAGITVYTPAMAFNKSGDEQPGITFDYSYKNISITENDVSKISYYVNLAMPVGTHTIRINVEGYGEVNGFSQVYTVTVTPKVISEDVQERITKLLGKVGGSGASVEKTFQNSEDESENGFLVEETTLTSLQNLLAYSANTENEDYIQTPRIKTHESYDAESKNYGAGFWAVGNTDSNAANVDDYYGGLEVTYNLLSSQNSRYGSYDQVAPTKVNSYVVYYAVSANNFVTLGGASAADRTDYRFTTVIYRKVTKPTVLDETYTGSKVTPTVVYDENQSRYYNYDFVDPDTYVNAGTDYKVKVTILDPTLSRWVDSDGNVLSDEVDYVSFKINPAQNSWDMNPSIFGWQYDGFKSASNTITSKLKFSSYKDAEGKEIDVTETIVSYSIHCIEVNDGIQVEKVIKFKEVKDGEWFKVDQSGVIIDDENGTIEKVLNALKPSDRYCQYYLYSKVDAYGVSGSEISGYEFNVKGIEQTQYQNFRIDQAVNVWDESPYIIRWNWGEYDKEINTISAVSVYPKANGSYDTENVPEIKYSVLDDKRQLISSILTDFTVDADGVVVSADVENALSGLTAGKYYLSAKRAGTAYYTDINATYSGFNIGTANNSWDTTPSITTYQYRRFTLDTNFIQGVPHYPLENKFVTYGVYRTSTPGQNIKPAAGANSVLFVFTSDDLSSETASAAIVEKFNELNQDGYWLVAYVDGETDKYNFMYAAGNFSVTQTVTNNWTENGEPTVSGWTYGEFNSGLVSKGEAEFGTVKYTVQLRDETDINKYTDVTGYVELYFEDTTAEEVTVAGLVTKLDTLDAGNYKLIVATETGSADYVQARRELLFVVTKADNDWKEGKTPTIEDWGYGENPKSPSTSGDTDLTENESGEIKYEYYVARSVNGQWIADKEQPVTLSNATPAGYYAMVATADASTNYNSVAHTAIFHITKTTNGWTVEPEGTLSWDWGADKIAETKLATAAADNGEVKYSIHQTDGTYTANDVSSADIAATLNNLNAGSYEITAGVTEGDNYTGVSKITYVTVNKVDFDFDPAPKDASWTWGVPESDMVFVKPVINPEKDGDVITAAYTVRKINGQAFEDVIESTDYDTVLSKLHDQGVGEYRIQIVFTSTNYNTDTKVVTLRIEPISVVFTTDAADTSWSWNNKDNSGKNITEPIAYATVNGEQKKVTFEYAVTVGISEYDTFASFEEFKNNMIAADAATYTVKLVLKQVGIAADEYDTDNFKLADTTFKVTVNKATNTWSPEPADTINKEFDETVATIVPPTPLFGDAVKYYEQDGTTEITNITDWINGKKTTGDYTFIIKAAELSGAYGNNYDEKSKTITLHVTLKASEWGNADSLKDSYQTYTFSENLAAQIAADLVLPTKPTQTGNNGTISYVVSWVDYKGQNKTDSNSYTNPAEIINYIKANAHAGEYTVKTVYTPSEGSNYGVATDVIVINVNRAEVSWIENTRPNSEYIASYKEIVIPDPVAAYNNVASEFYTKKITVSVKDTVDNQYDLEGKALSVFAKDLHVGTYFVTVSMADTEDYYGFETVTTRLIIGAALNDWTAESKANLKKSWEVYRIIENGNQAAGYTFTIPSALYGTVRCLIGAAEFTTTDALVAEIKGRSAGTYNVEFVVDAPETGDYNGLRYEFTITVKLNDNEWIKSAEKSHSWVGAVKFSEFVIPKAKVYDELLRFDIVQRVGNSPVELYMLTLSSFEEELSKLTNGNYAIIMHVGGNYRRDENTYFKTLFETYKENYNELIATTEISITIGNNGMTFSSTPWQYGEDPANYVVKPTATEGFDTITFKVLQNGSLIQTIEKTSDGNYTFENLIAYLKDLSAGTYTVTASIDATSTYDSASASITVTINKADNDWDKHVGNNSSVEWTYMSSDNAAIEFVPMHTATSAEGVTVPVTVTVNGNPVPTGMSYGDYLKKLGAGTYTIVASYPAITNYNAITETVTLIVNRAENGWYFDNNKMYALTIAQNWTWDNGSNKIVTGFNAPIPKFGNTSSGATVTVRVNKVITNDDDTTSTELVFEVYFTYTLNGEDELVVVDEQVSAIIARLQALDAGTYRITAILAASDYYSEHVQDAIEFTVSQATNEWNQLPQIGWDFGGTTVYPTAIPKYGQNDSIKFTYAAVYKNGVARTFDEIKNVPSEWSDGQPAAAGKYFVRATLTATNNYTGLDDAREFSINEAANDWTKRPSVVEWTWNNYNPSINLFAAAARSNQPANFRIYVKDSSVQGSQRALAQDDFVVTGDVTYSATWITLLTTNGFTLGSDGLVSDNVKIALNALKPSQTYLLVVNIAGGENLQSITNENDPFEFSVDKAANSWDTAPTVVSYDYNAIGSSFTAGVSKYGSNGIKYRLIGTPNGSADNSYNSGELTATGVRSELAGLSAGSYTLYAWVVEGDTYDALSADDTASGYRVNFKVNRLTTDWADDTQPDAINVTYVKLHESTTALSDLIKKQPAATSGATATYVLRNEQGGLITNASLTVSGSVTIKNSYAYGELFGIIKALNSGSYTLEVRFDESVNYLALSKTVALNITRIDNAWQDDLPDVLTTGKWNRGEDNANASEFTQWAKVALKGDSDSAIRFTVGTSSTQYDYDELKAFAASLDAGTYTVYVTASQTNSYNALGGTTSIVVEKRDNSWSATYSAAASIKNVEGNTVTTWTWGDKVTFTCVAPTFGTRVAVTVTKGDNTVAYITLDFSAGEAAVNLAIKSVGDTLSALGAGSYKLNLTVAEETDWKVLTDRVDFTVSAVVENEWNTPPVIDDSKWTYGGTVPTPMAEAKFGNQTVTFAWAFRTDGVAAKDVPAADWKLWSQTVPVTAGKYWLRASVAATDDYAGLVDYYAFTIQPGQNDWTTVPGVNGWNWNEFSATSNVFVGSARSGGGVTFGVYASYTVEESGAVTKTKLTENDFYAYDGTTVTTDDIDKISSFTLTNGIVSADIVSILKALKPGTYYVVGSAAAGNSYGELKFGATSFTVGTASNEWNPAPNSYSYTYNEFRTTGDLAWVEPAAKYGTPLFTVKLNEKAVDGYIGLTAEQLAAKLKDSDTQLKAGNYRLHISVAAKTEGTTIYYYGISEIDVAFNVNKINAAWTKAPVSTHTVTHLALSTETENFILKGTAISNSESPVVSFRIVASDNGSETTANNDNFLNVIRGLAPGTYTVYTTYAQTTNYTATPEASTTLTITRIKLVLTGLPTGNAVQGIWDEDGNVYTVGGVSYGFNNIDVDYKTYTGGKKLTLIYTLDNTAVNNSDYLNKLSKLTQGSHNFVISAQSTDDFELDAQTIVIEVSAAQNRFLNTESGSWNLSASFTENGTPIALKNSVIEWKWNSVVELKLVGAEYGSRIYVDIIGADGTSRITVNKSIVSTTDATNDFVIDDDTIAKVNEVLKKLAVGNYTITVSTESTNDYAAATQSISVRVNQAANYWEKNPEFVGSSGKLHFDKDSGVYTWQYGYTPDYVDARAHYGDYTVIYKKAGSTETYTAIPTDVGKYEAIFTVAADTTKYEGIGNTVVKFEITKAELRDFVGIPTITGWTWNEFDKSKHLFKVTASSGGKVTFDIVDKNGSPIVANITATDNKADDKFVTALNSLDVGTYTVVVKVAETDNYSSFESNDLELTVTQATNVWEVSPRIIPWSQSNSYDPDENIPTAVAKYGDVKITITFSEDSDTYYYEAVLSKAKDSDGNYIKDAQGNYEIDYDEKVNELAACAPGRYVMHVEVEADPSKYTGLSEDLDFIITESESIKNYWSVQVGISGWVANEVKEDGKPGTFNKPVGRAGMGKIQYTVCYSKKEDGIVKIDETKTVGKDDGFLLPGDTYTYSYYLPIEPGTYYLKAEAICYKAGTNIRDEQYCMSITPYMFTVEKRINTFKSEPQIDKKWYLGDKENWVQPTAEFTEGTVEFTYRKLDEDGEEIDEDITDITEPGKYVLVATGSAKFSDDDVRKYKFEVFLSKNGWVSAPTIDDWSEEADPNNPFGEAQVGSENIQYSYATKENPQVPLPEKPTTEGNYIMYATLEMEGYETLVAEYEFTIDAAFDMTLLVVDIILGFAACALAVVVIVFAIRRYKEC